MATGLQTSQITQVISILGTKSFIQNVCKNNFSTPYTSNSTDDGGGGGGDNNDHDHLFIVVVIVAAVVFSVVKNLLLEYRFCTQ